MLWLAHLACCMVCTVESETDNPLNASVGNAYVNFLFFAKVQTQANFCCIIIHMCILHISNTRIKALTRYPKAWTSSCLTLGIEITVMPVAVSHAYTCTTSARFTQNVSMQIRVKNKVTHTPHKVACLLFYSCSIILYYIINSSALYLIHMHILHCMSPDMRDIKGCVNHALHVAVCITISCMEAV